jgi:hypothetical protein
LLPTAPIAYNNKASAYHQHYPTFPACALPAQQNVVPFVRPSGLHVYGQPAYGSSYMPQASGLQQKVGNSLYSLGHQGFYAGNNLEYMGQAGSMLQPAAEMASSLLPEGHDFRAGRHLPFTGTADSSVQQSFLADGSMQQSYKADSNLQPSFKADSSNPQYMQQGSGDSVHVQAEAGSSMQQIGQKSHLGSMQQHLDQNFTAGSHSERQQNVIQLLGQNFQPDCGENQADSYTVQQQQQLGQAGSSVQYQAESPLLGSKMKHQELSSCSIEQGFQGNSKLMNQEQSSFAGRAAGVVLQQQMGRNPFPNSSLEEIKRSSCDGGNKKRFEQGDTVHLYKQKSSSKIKGSQVIRY